MAISNKTKVITGINTRLSYFHGWEPVSINGGAEKYSVCRHTYCSNQAKAGMNPKTLQYLMGHSEIGVTMNVYTHLGLDDAKDEMIRLEELEQARKEVEKTSGQKLLKQAMFKAI